MHRAARPQFERLGACALGLASFVSACGAPSAAPALTPSPEAASATASSASAVPAPLPLLLPREQLVATRLKDELSQFLALGERPFDGWNLASATDHVAARLGAYGHTVQRRGFSHGEAVAQNIEAEVTGLRLADEIIVVAARLDSNPGSPGANDNGSGVAAALVLAEQAAGHRALRTLRFVFFSSAGPRAAREAQGAFHYAESLKAEGKKVFAVVELRGLGRYRSEEGSQSYPSSMPVQSSSRGDFIALVAPAETPDVAEALGSVFESTVTLPALRWQLPHADPFLADSAAREFAERGMPCVLVTDTQQLRDSDFGGPKDALEHLDIDRLARVVAALEPSLHALTGPEGDPSDAEAAPPPQP